MNDTLRHAILELVEIRNGAISTGARDALDRTYVGLDSRDHSLERADHERTSYYDWYMNRIERGMGAEITAVHVVPVYDLGTLPYRYNADWTGDQPEFELQVRSSQNVVSWYINRDVLNGNALRVILPNFSDAPWKAPILETRGGSVEFNSETFAAELALAIGLEFCSWGPRLEGLVKIRAFALYVDPYCGWLHPCLLSDNENFNESEYGKWALGGWRFYNFPDWPYTHELCQAIESCVKDKPHDHMHPKFDYWVQPKEDFEILLACVQSLQKPDFLRYLERFDLTPDFQTAVFHGHDEHHECNFVEEQNQDLSVLLKR